MKSEINGLTASFLDIEFTIKGIYQISFRDQKKQDFTLFVEFKEATHEIKDVFCSCGTKKCDHEHAAMALIFQKDKPLHQEFNESIFNFLFRLLARRHGFHFPAVDEQGDLTLIQEEKMMYCIHFKSDQLIQEIIDKKRGIEEGSMYFFGYSEEERDKYYQGDEPLELSYELSDWIEMAKLMFLDSVFGKEGESFHFDRIDMIPKSIHAATENFQLEILLAKVNWKHLVHFLPSLHTKLRFYEFVNTEIEEIYYDEKHRTFQIVQHPMDLDREKAFPVCDNIVFFPHKGFVDWQFFSYANTSIVPTHQIAEFLQNYEHILNAHLKNCSMNSQVLSVQYKLFFDAKKALHIQKYFFDASEDSSHFHFFGRYVYIPQKGFYVTGSNLFSDFEKVIAQEKVGQFIEKYRSWIHQFDGFHIHLTKISAKYVYHVDETALTIDLVQDTLEENQKVLDLGRWFYIDGEGFFEKEQTLLEGDFPLQIPAGEISSFIDKNRSKLEHIPHFFIEKSPIEQSGFIIDLEDEETIHMYLDFTFENKADRDVCLFFDMYGFIPGRGFFPLFEQMKMENQLRKKKIPKASWNVFFKYEFAKIRPYILKIDPRLELVEDPALVLLSLQQEPGGWRACFSVRNSYGEVPLPVLLHALEREENFVITNIGRFDVSSPSQDWLKLFPLGAGDDTAVHIPTLILLKIFFMKGVYFSKSLPEEHKDFAIRLLQFDIENLFSDPHPKGFKSTLRQYQQFGLKWLWFLYNLGLSGFLSDEMGLGKTHQAMGLIASIVSEKKKQNMQPILIVCPTSVIYHWQDLINTFLPKMKILLYHGSFRSSRKINSSQKIIVTSYGILRSEEVRFKKIHYELVILDEIHVAKNSKSQLHKALVHIKANMKLGITGTPIENHLSELKALFDLVLPGYLPREKIYEGQISDDKLQQVKKLITPFILRRKKEDVLLDLPEKIEEDLFLDLSLEQRKMYDEAIKKKTHVFQESDEKQFAIHIFALINELKQICNHPSLIYKDIDRFEQHESSKLESFIEILEETLSNGKKLVVFSHYLDMLAIIRLYLQRNHIGYAEIIGKTTDRREQTKKFQNDPKIQVFLASLGAAGVGIDLTAASVVVLYDRWWNPAKEQQAIDRTHRFGQKRGVNVFKFVIKNTVEEKIHALLQKKTTLSNKLLSFDDMSSAKSLTIAELKALFDDLL